MSWHTCARCGGKFWPASPTELTCGRCFPAGVDVQAFREMFGLGHQVFVPMTDEEFLRAIKVRIT